MILSETDALVRLSMALALGDEDRLRGSMEACLAVVETEAAEEVILQSYLFLGYPVTLNAFGLWREVSGLEPQGSAAEDWEGWARRGVVACETVYGGQYPELRANIRSLHPDMERWMVVEGYGKVLSRPGLPLSTRELCIVGLLALRDLPRQLYSHLRGALNAGASLREVGRVVEMACADLGPKEEASVRRVWEQVSDRWRKSRAGTGP